MVGVGPMYSKLSLRTPGGGLFPSQWRIVPFYTLLPRTGLLVHLKGVRGCHCSSSEKSLRGNSQKISVRESPDSYLNAVRRLHLTKYLWKGEQVPNTGTEAIPDMQEEGGVPTTEGLDEP